jgi:hypothetical protein
MRGLASWLLKIPPVLILQSLQAIKIWTFRFRETPAILATPFRRNGLRSLRKLGCASTPEEMEHNHDQPDWHGGR